MYGKAMKFPSVLYDVFFLHLNSFYRNKYEKRKNIRHAFGQCVSALHKKSGVERS